MINGGIVSTLVAKDISLYFRNRFFALITVGSMVFFVAAYLLMPNTVDETLSFAVYAPVMPPALAERLADEGVVLESLPSEEALKAAVAGGDYQAGVVLPPDMTEQIMVGHRPQVNLYLAASLPPEFSDIFVLLARELAYLVGGQPLDIETHEEVLGPDMAGQQIPPRDRIRPLLAVFVLTMETLGLASLITTEIESGTLRALMVTPMRVPDLFVGKGLVGTGLAFGQAALLAAITGGLARQPLLILLALLLGAVMVTGLAFLIASVARDFMSVMGWGILVLLLLVVPGLAILLPGLVSGWVRVLPTHYLVDTVHRVINFEASWTDVRLNLAVLAGFAAVFLALGIVALRRRFT